MNFNDLLLLSEARRGAGLNASSDFPPNEATAGRAAPSVNSEPGAPAAAVTQIHRKLGDGSSGARGLRLTHCGVCLCLCAFVCPQGGVDEVL